MVAVSAPRRAVVTGATGFVASRLARRLVELGWDVTAMVRDPSVDLPCPALGWPRSGTEAADVFGRLRPDRCFHLATRFQPRHDPDDVVALVDGNVTLAALVGEGAASVEGCGVVYTSTYWQHFEGAAYAPTSLYAAMKQASADVLRYYADCGGLPVLSLTLFNTYGPGEPANRITSLLARSALSRQPVDLSPGEQLVDLLHVDDVVTALVAAEARLGHDVAEHGPGWSEWTARSAQPVTLRTLAERVGRVVGAAPPVNFGALPYRPREMFEPWATAPDLPGWRPAIDLDQGLDTLVASLR